MTETRELITIGAMARATGLTASALRFYADGGLLVPARVDPVTGYRYYAPDQCERAILVRRLREIGIPLDTVAEILAGDPLAAGRVLDDHVRALSRRAERAAAVAAAVKRVIGATAVTLSGPVIAESIDQVVDAAARDRAIPILAGVLVEVDVYSVTFTATDRYRLSTRTVVPDQPGVDAWQRVVAAGELAALRERLRRCGAVALSRTEDGIALRGDDFEARCATVDGAYPDYRAMWASLAPVTTRLVVGRAAILDALEGVREPVWCTACATELTLRTTGLESTEPRRIPASGTGPSVDIGFSPAVLRPSVAAALGPDIMLDLAGCDQPVVVRSATDGDLASLVMPRAPATENDTKDSP
ncbi:DNA polymerase III subunit beta family protein [Nocardia arizonensis]|uniref:DNA polymerase III subunit beta family protein n=1 Tax=Nocardia arizonensis TaxID=1141647 RepID=UPI0006CFF01E|nr:MerR family transcriptional regulator [Nocardia arizonensis]